MKKCLYIIGSPFSGSTLISENLSKYNNVISIGESNRYYDFLTQE